LEEGLALLNFTDRGRDNVLPLLRKYIEEIELFNPAYGLVKVRDREELIVKHILDSLAALGIIGSILGETGAAGESAGTGRAAGEQPAIADAGSGAGFPGIPLAIAMPGARFTLIERMRRRAGFLRECSAVLGLANVAVEETEMEKIACDPAAGRFQAVVFRAFRPLEPGILRGLFRLLAPGGVLAAYKGRREAVEQEMAAAEKAMPELGGRWEALPLEVPFLDEERRLVLIRGGKDGNPAG
jgi:16S rRNA (guanine527-N7)-methyltransferase